MNTDWRAALLARRTLGVRLGTASMAAVLDRLVPGTRDQPPFFVTQIVGTNGKGSTAALLDHGLRGRAHGPVGLYTSPHLHRLNERVRVDGEAIADEPLFARFAAVAEAEAKVGVSLSFFEVLTTMALLEFVDAGCTQVILEAGLGGRLDATAAIVPGQVLISRIGLDHQEFLGATLTAIAEHKAGVMRAGTKVSSVAQPDEAWAVIEAIAAARGATVERVEPLARAPIGLPGEHQRHNAALALAGLRRIHPDAAPELFDGVSWPGRLERRAIAGGELWLDVAHNLDGVAALSAAIEELGITPAVIVFGTLADKPGARMLELLRRHAPVWSAPPASEEVFVPAADTVAPELRFEAADDPRLLAALRERLSGGARVLVCGSHYLVGALVRALEHEGGAAADPGDPRR